jgi:hypothetical protein
MYETTESPKAAGGAGAPSFTPTELISAAPPAGAIGDSNAESLKFTEPESHSVLDEIEMGPPEPPQPPAPPYESERRTIVMAEQSSQLRRSKGRIVGWLITYSHNPEGEDFRLYAGYNRIGANPVCDIVLEDETVSGSHAIIVYRDGRCLIKDDLSRNGTFVNGREIGEAHPLNSYDQIRVGNTYLTFVAAQPVS